MASNQPSLLEVSLPALKLLFCTCDVTSDLSVEQEKSEHVSLSNVLQAALTLSLLQTNRVDDGKEALKTSE